VKLERATAFVVDSFDFGEADRIVVFFSAAQGCKRAVARGARRKYSRLQGRLELLARVEVVWYEREGAELARVSDVELEQSADFLLRNLELMMLAAYVAEHVVAFVPENEENAPVFRLLDKLLEQLRLGLDPSRGARYFELWMLRLAGVLPSLRACSACDKEWLQANTAVLVGDVLLCEDCAPAPSGVRWNASLMVAANRFMQRRPGDLASDDEVRPGFAAANREWERLALQVRRNFLGRELKSYEVMKRTLEP
jgi:DNA repair protein RecO (recombination protein O)